MQGNPTDEKLRCVRCGEVIGAYEPLIVVIDGEAHKTSRNLARERDCRLEECYHHDCYEEAWDGELRDPSRSLPAP